MSLKLLTDPCAHVMSPWHQDPVKEKGSISVGMDATNVFDSYEDSFEGRCLIRSKGQRTVYDHNVEKKTVCEKAWIFSHGMAYGRYHQLDKLVQKKGNYLQYSLTTRDVLLILEKRGGWTLVRGICDIILQLDARCERCLAEMRKHWGGQIQSL